MAERGPDQGGSHFWAPVSFGEPGVATGFGTLQDEVRNLRIDVEKLKQIVNSLIAQSQRPSYAAQLPAQEIGRPWLQAPPFAPHPPLLPGDQFRTPETHWNGPR